MDEKMAEQKIEQQKKVEENIIEHEEYSKSRSQDDFKTWELKKYIDGRIMKVVFIIVVGATLGLIIFFRFF